MHLPDPEYDVPRKRMYAVCGRGPGAVCISRRASLILGSPLEFEGIAEWVR